MLLDATTTPINDLLLWAHLDFVITISAVVAALANMAAIWRNLVLSGRLLKRLAEHDQRSGPPEDGDAPTQRLTPPGGDAPTQRL